MKTAVTVLQEMMIKMGLMPDYECISQSGPQHQAMFKYRCVACGEVVTAEARSKKEAKQEVARLMLQRLALTGHPVPPPFGLVASSTMDDDVIIPGSADPRSYVALLKELCQEYRLQAVEYELVGDTGPPHLRHFTVRATIGQHGRLATSTTKKAARQLAAEKLYTYLRENLSRVTREFNESEALARAYEKTMERHPDPEEYSRRPDLGMRIADYHTGLPSLLDAESKPGVSSLLQAERPRCAASPERVLAGVAAALRLDVANGQLQREGAEPLAVLSLTGCTPELSFAGADAAAACSQALGYIYLMMDEDLDLPAGLLPAPSARVAVSDEP